MYSGPGRLTSWAGSWYGYFLCAGGGGGARWLRAFGVLPFCPFRLAWRGSDRVAPPSVWHVAYGWGERERTVEMRHDDAPHPGQLRIRARPGCIVSIGRGDVNWLGWRGIEYGLGRLFLCFRLGDTIGRGGQAIIFLCNPTDLCLHVLHAGATTGIALLRRRQKYTNHPFE